MNDDFPERIMRTMVWVAACASMAIGSQLWADDLATLKKAGLPGDPKALATFFDTNASAKASKAIDPEAFSAAVRRLIASDEPMRLKALWTFAMGAASPGEREEIVAAIADADRRAGQSRFLLEAMKSPDAASKEWAAYGAARYFEPQFRRGAIEASPVGAARGLLGPTFVDGLRDAQAAAREILVGNSLVPAEEFRNDRIGKAAALPGVEYFRRRIPTPVQTESIREALADLGSADFRRRERASSLLAAAGEPALPFLRPLEFADDAEVRLRVRRCLTEIDRRKVPDGSLAALRILAWNASPTNAETSLRTLLEYAPCVENREVEDLLLHAVAMICIRAGGATETIEAARTADKPERRAVAEWVRGKIDVASPDNCPGCEDASPLVRLRAAEALVFAESRAGVERLIRMIPDLDPRYVSEVEELLVRLAGDGAPSVSFANAAGPQRAKARDAWLAWANKNASKIDVAALRRERPYLGIITISENEIAVPKKGGGSRVWQRGRDGRELWSIGNFQGATAFDLLRNGHVLVFEARGRRIVERDAQGKDCWELPIQVGAAIAVSRLANGNTFVATHNQFFEVAPDKTVVASHAIPAGTYVYSAHRTDDGRVVCMTSRGGLIEFDAASGKELRTIPIQQGAATGMNSVQSYAKDRYLISVPHLNGGQVMDVDETGKILWKATYKGVYRAIKLPTGNVVVASYQDRKVAELDRSGRVVWETTCAAQPTGLHAR